MIGEWRYRMIIMFGFDMLLGVESRVVDTIFENSIKIKIIISKKFHAFNFTNHYIIEGRCMCLCINIKVIGSRNVVFAIKDEYCDTQLHDSEVIGCLFDPLIKLHMVGEETLNPVQLSYQTRELTIKSNKITYFNALDDRR